ncbi:MAG: DUF4384 domain-containing protein [Elusimicrobiota bacterium]
MTARSLLALLGACAVLSSCAASRRGELQNPASAVWAPAAPGRSVGQAESVEPAGKILGVDPDGCTWLEGAASVAVGSQETRHQARAAAMEQARAAAVRDFLGVEVKSKFMDFQQEGLRRESRLTEAILETTRNGRIVKEAVLEEGYRDAADCPGCLYRMRIKACVVPRESGGDQNFHVALTVSSPRFRHGEDAVLSVTATRDCWIYLYNVYDLGVENRTAMLVPNDIVGEMRLQAGQTWEYPDEESKKRGVRLIAQMPGKGDDVSAETIRVIAAKAALAKSVFNPADGGWLGVLRRLLKARVEWADDAQAYTIYKQ